MPGATRPALASALAVLLSLTVVAGASTATGPTADIAANPDHLTGTVRYVDADSGGFEVITGFHLALKVVYIHVEEETEITMEGEAYPMSELEAGQIVRVEYHEADEQKIAETVEVIDEMTEGGGR